MNIKDGLISFRPLQEADLPLMHRWLNTPHVSEWWNLDGNHHPSLEAVERKYPPRINGLEPVDCYLIYYDDKPIGMIQLYRLDDFPVEKAMFGLDEGCAGVDLFIGEVDYVHQGLGSGIIRQFLGEMVFTDERISRCVIDPDPKNIIAVKAYRKSGFKYLKTIWNDQEKVHTYLMIVNRDEIDL
jgi:aminoglycoside 6'-N-acetyltransferase